MVHHLMNIKYVPKVLWQAKFAYNTTVLLSINVFDLYIAVF